MAPEDLKDPKNTEEEEKLKSEQEKPEPQQEKPEAEEEKPPAEQERPEPQQEKPEPEEEKPSADPAEVKKASNVIQFFKKSFSLIKLYPPENPSVAKSIDLFNNQLGEFLNEYEELAIQVGEFSFAFKGELVFQDEERSKSLPFLLYKDGLRELSFHQGLDKQELQEFFRTISEIADLPPEDADIVNSLWEKNFVHIRYYSMDDFLDQEIGEPTEEITTFDKAGFAKGKVEMTPDDEDLFKKSFSLSIKEGREKGEGEYEGDEAGTGMVPGTEVGAASKDEMSEIQSMISESRKIPHRTELIDLLFELLFLEQREEEFAAITEVLNGSQQDVLEENNFSMGLSILNRVEELKKIISPKSEERAKLLGRISDNAKKPEFIANLRKMYSEGRVTDFETFFEYLEHLGVSAFPVIAAIWGESKFPYSRQKASNFLKKIGKQDLNSLLNLARGQSASLTREILSILTTAGKKTQMARLEDFINHPDKAIRLDVINALGKTGDEASNKLLLRFLPDKDTQIRTAALKSLKYLGDSATLDHVKQMAQEKGFREKGRREKEAILKYLASTQSKEISAFLRSLLKKRKIFFPHKTNEIRLCAASALGVMTTAEARNILKEGTKIRHKAIRQACKQALMNIGSGEVAKEEIKEEPNAEIREEPKKEVKEEPKEKIKEKPKEDPEDEQGA
jgi:hypothetical protein